LGHRYTFPLIVKWIVIRLWHEPPNGWRYPLVGGTG
jgi:hypothetical protein